MNSIWKLLEKIIRFILEKTIHINISADQWNGLVQFIKFGIVGLSNTVISYLLYVGALLIFQKNSGFLLLII